MNLTLGVVGLDRDRHRRHPEPRVSRNVLSQETSAQQSQVETKDELLEEETERGQWTIQPSFDLTFLFSYSCYNLLRFVNKCCFVTKRDYLAF